MVGGIHRRGIRREHYVIAGSTALEVHGRDISSCAEGYCRSQPVCLEGECLEEAADESRVDATVTVTVSEEVMSVYVSSKLQWQVYGPNEVAILVQEKVER